MIRKVIVSVALCAAFILGGKYVYDRMTAVEETPMRRGFGRGLLVETLTLSPRDVQETLRGYGTARAYREAEMSSRVAGQIVEISKGLRVGSVVKKGDLLLRIDPDDYEQERLRSEAQLAQSKADLSRIEVELVNLLTKKTLAESDLQVAIQEYDRIKSLTDQNVAAATDLDTQRLRKQVYQRSLLDLERQCAVCEPQILSAKAMIMTRESDLQRARLDLERTRITAPFDGVVGEMLVEVGELVRLNQPLLTVVDLSRLEMPVSLPASQLKAVEIGSVARIYEEMSDEPIARATITRISPAIDEISRTFEVFLVIDTPGEQGVLRPGLFLRAEIDGRHYENILTVPRSLFVGDVVYVDVDGAAKAVTPRMVASVGDFILVDDTLTSGAMIISSNLEVMFDGRDVITGDVPVMPMGMGMGKGGPGMKGGEEGKGKGK